jgi:6-phosphogluconolactonase
MNPNVQVSPDPEGAARAATAFIAARLEEALRSQEAATVAFSGGSAPKSLFARLAALPFKWERVHIFWVDERSVPPTHSDSNYRLARELLLEPARIPEAQVHRIRGELDPQQAARDYAEEIRRFFRLDPGIQPAFDVLHLGLGPDGHTASLFPGEPMLEDRTQIASARFVPRMNTWRITLMPGALLSARHLFFFTVGEDKAEVVQSVLGPGYNPGRWPAQVIVHHRPDVAWFIDRAAAEKISRPASGGA